MMETIFIIYTYLEIHVLLLCNRSSLSPKDNELLIQNQGRCNKPFLYNDVISYCIGYMWDSGKPLVVS